MRGNKMKVSRKVIRGRSRWKLPLLAVLICLFFSIGVLALLTNFSPATAQTGIRAPDVGQQIYQLDPDLPLENQYVNKETREASPSNTLVSRLVRYHTYTKGRSPLYRLDWKLTLADYLGVNDRISVSVYPGADTLRSNPAQGDIAAIQKLTRAQRESLVEALVTVFSQAAAATPATPAATPAPAPQAAPAQPNASPSPAPRTVAPQTQPQTVPQREPRPGDAELLLAP
jgi:hypothetical protein